MDGRKLVIIGSAVLVLSALTPQLPPRVTPAAQRVPQLFIVGMWSARHSEEAGRKHVINGSVHPVPSVLTPPHPQPQIPLVIV